MLPFRIENITQPIIVYYTNVLHYKIEGNIRGCRDRDLQLPMQSLSITTNVASSNPAHEKWQHFEFLLYIFSLN
jgi:hypothetical protein